MLRCRVQTCRFEALNCRLRNRANPRCCCWCPLRSIVRLMQCETAKAPVSIGQSALIVGSPVGGERGKVGLWQFVTRHKAAQTHLVDIDTRSSLCN